jgi:hypothetical protein
MEETVDAEGCEDCCGQEEEPRVPWPREEVEEKRKNEAGVSECEAGGDGEEPEGKASRGELARVGVGRAAECEEGAEHDVESDEREDEGEDACENRLVGILKLA